MQHEDLNQVEIQALVEYVNTEVQEENDCKFSSLVSDFSFHLIQTWWFNYRSSFDSPCALSGEIFVRSSFGALEIRALNLTTV